MEGDFSEAKRVFDVTIKDAEDLLEYCNSLGHPLPQRAEVFKRAGLVMALTAWETYVEDRVREGILRTVSKRKGHAERPIQTRLEEELKRFHNPSADKTKKLFTDYLRVDVTAAWSWQNYNPATARKKLDSLVKKRGDAVHRSNRRATGPSGPHLVTKGELEKAIRFFRDLVVATDKSLLLLPDPVPVTSSDSAACSTHVRAESASLRASSRSP